MEYGLVFERFLNIERNEMPDIDLDFQDDRRDELISYVTRKYGAEHVAQIISPSVRLAPGRALQGRGPGSRPSIFDGGYRCQAGPLWRQVHR